MNFARKRISECLVKARLAQARWLALIVLSAGSVAVLVGCGSGAPAPAAKPAALGEPKARLVGAAGAETHASNRVATGPSSVFQVALPSGRDPFFPGSSRKAAPDGALASRLPLTSYLKLAGLRPGKTRPMALINRTAFSPGEEGTVSIIVTNQLNKAEMQKVNVRCVEIRRDSVVISIAGEDGLKELHMAPAK